MKETLKLHEEKMTKTVNVLVKDLAAIRAGRANPAVLDKITIEYYGTPTPLNQVAAVSTPEPRTLMIQPWDGSTLKAIEKAIYASDLGLNPQNDGKSIRLNFPPLTEERRRDLIKQCSKMGEESKVAVRNIRRDTIDTFKRMKKDSQITEDDQKDGEDKIQKITDKFIKEIDGIIAKKSKELSEV